MAEFAAAEVEECVAAVHGLAGVCVAAAHGLVEVFVAAAPGMAAAHGTVEAGMEMAGTAGSVSGSDQDGGLGGGVIRTIRITHTHTIRITPTRITEHRLPPPRHSLTNISNRRNRVTGISARTRRVTIRT